MILNLLNFSAAHTTACEMAPCCSAVKRKTFEGQNIHGFQFFLNHEFSDAMTMKSNAATKVFHRYSLGDITTKVLSLECFIQYSM